MWKRICKMGAVLVCLLYVCLSVSTTYASQTFDVKSTASTIHKIMNYKLKEEEVDSIQDLLNINFSKNPTSGVAETYCLSLPGFYNDLDYRPYLSKLLETLKSKDQWSSIKAPSFQKHALVHEALSKDNPLLSYAKEHTLGKDGIMSNIYGLFLLKASGEEVTTTLTKELYDGLLDYQLLDGGFSYTGNVGDVDVTAFALQALAPYVEVDQRVGEAVNEALDFLSKKQLISGDFKSYDMASCESTAQVMLALCALDIDYTSDTRFIKNSNTVKDGLMRYQLLDGSFAHSVNGQSNDMATAQAFSALVALYRYETNQSFLYDYGEEGYDAKTVSSHTNSSIPYQWILTGIIVILAGLYSVLFARRSKKRLISTAIIAILLLMATWMIQIQSSEDYYSKQQTNITKPINVTIAIRCDTVAGKESFLPEDGYLLPTETVTVNKGDTVLDVLKKVTAEHKIQMEYKDAGYIEGIGYLYEQDYGNLSGWMYQVNGNFISEGANKYKVNEGDEIVWHYSLTLGKDVGGEYNE